MKNLLNLGKPLSKEAQKSIIGGKLDPIKKRKCSSNSDCPGGGVCATFQQQTGDYPAGKYCL